MFPRLHRVADACSRTWLWECELLLNCFSGDIYANGSILEFFSADAHDQGRKYDEADGQECKSPEPVGSVLSFACASIIKEPIESCGNLLFGPHRLFSLAFSMNQGLS